MSGINYNPVPTFRNKVIPTKIKHSHICKVNSNLGTYIMLMSNIKMISLIFHTPIPFNSINLS